MYGTCGQDSHSAGVLDRASVQTGCFRARTRESCYQRKTLEGSADTLVSSVPFAYLPPHVCGRNLTMMQTWLEQQRTIDAQDAWRTSRQAQRRFEDHAQAQSRAADPVEEEDDAEGSEEHTSELQPL